MTLSLQNLTTQKEKVIETKQLLMISICKIFKFDNSLTAGKSILIFSLLVAGQLCDHFTGWRIILHSLDSGPRAVVGWFNLHRSFQRIVRYLHNREWVLHFEEDESYAGCDNHQE